MLSDPTGLFISFDLSAYLSFAPRLQRALNTVQVGLDAASFYTAVASSAMWGMRAALEGFGGSDNRWDATVISISGSFQAGFGEFGSTLFDAMGIGTGISLRAGFGGAFNWDFLIMDDGYVYPYFAKGFSLGSQGAGLSLEIGCVDDVSVPSDYEGGFLSVTGSLQEGIPNVFGVGVSGSAFISFPGVFNGLL